MPKRNRIPSLKEMSGGSRPARSVDTGLPTFEDVFFGRGASRAGSEQTVGEESAWSVEIPKDVENVGTEVYTAPTQNPQRPRAYTIGYNHNTNAVVIIMSSGAWWQYNDVPVSTWVDLTNSASTNAFLPTLEAACSSHHAANLDALSESTKTRFSQTAATASRIQKGNTVLDDVMEGKSSIQSFSAEELFRNYL